ncbi:hypothetical protein [uncultured Helicobacter sp.]|uniref:hypothetical protein n=1 Tax=uncultured Helicobacter sp. TaxID=175537 RepID=UPI0037512B28
MKESSVFYVLICIIHFLYAQEIENIKVEKFRKEGLPLFYRLDYIPLKNRNITIGVLQMGLENSTESQCVNQKTKQQMQKYLYLHIPHLHHSFEDTTLVGECDYKGRVKMLGRIWDFESMGGKTTLKTNISSQEQIKDSMKEWYLCPRSDGSGDMCYIELACLLPECYPRAIYYITEMQEKYENKLQRCKHCK